MSIPEEQSVCHGTHQENKDEAGKSKHIRYQEMAPQIAELASHIVDVQSSAHPLCIHEEILIGRPCEKI